MQIGPKSMARALEVRARIDQVLAEVKKHDNAPDGDLDNRPGEVVLSMDAMRGKGLDSLKIPVPTTWGVPWKDEVQQARLSFDPASGKIKSGDVNCDRYYDSSYGRSAADEVRYSVQTSPGLIEYTEKHDVYYHDDNTIEKVRVDAATGSVLSYHAKEYAETFPEALKDVCTSFAGVSLVATAGLLCGMPGTLGGVLFGPVAGVVAAGATAIGLAYYKTRPWSRHLPQHNA